jgi:hypothetical protein
VTALCPVLLRADSPPQFWAPGQRATFFAPQRPHLRPQGLAWNLHFDHRLKGSDWEHTAAQRALTIR